MTKPSVAIAYRVYPGVSKEPFVYKESKLKLFEAGLHSFKESLINTNFKIFFLLDGCSSDYEQIVYKYFEIEQVEILNLDKLGNLATFKLQIDILLKQDFSENIYFAEDDYIYKPNSFHLLVDFLTNNKLVDFVSPFDHIDYYEMDFHRNAKYLIKNENGYHWRTSASTCLTFLTTKTNLSSCKEVFLSYSNGNWDSSLWMSLTKYNVFNLFLVLKSVFFDIFVLKMILTSWRYSFLGILLFKKRFLWTPLPSIATHMQITDIAPNVDWNQFVIKL